MVVGFNGKGYGTTNTIYYKWDTVSGTAINQDDLEAGSLNGSFNFSQNYPTINTITFNFTFKAEYPADNESNVVKFQIYSDSGFSNLLAESSNITIVDATGAAPTQWSVTNPSIQWIWEANGFLKNSTGTISADTATENEDQWGFYNNAGGHGALTETEWIADKDIVKTSYTTNSGETRYYLTFENDLDFCTNSNSSDGNAVRTNGGFTYFYVKMPWSYGSTTGWGRYFLYSGFCEMSGNFTGGRNPSTSYQYSEMGSYERNYNSSSDYQLYYLPRGASSGGSTNAAYATKQYERFDSGRIEYVVVVFNFGTSSNNDYYNSTYTVSTRIENTLTGALHTSFNNTTYSNTYGSQDDRMQDVDTGANIARPFFHDSIYWSDGAHDTRWVMAGWANRPYTNTEQNTLLTELIDLYGQ